MNGFQIGMIVTFDNKQYKVIRRILDTEVLEIENKKKEKFLAKECELVIDKEGYKKWRINEYTSCLDFEELLHSQQIP